MSASNWVTRSSGSRRALDQLGGAAGAADGGTELRRGEVLVADRGSARRRRPGAARGRRRYAGRDGARMAEIIRVVEDLPLVPTTWMDCKRALRVTQRRHQPAHPVAGRTACRTAPARAASARPRAGHLGAPSCPRRTRQRSRQRFARQRCASHRAPSSAFRRASLSRSSWTTSGRALATNPSLASLRSARSISASSLPALLGHPGRRALDVEIGAGEDLHLTAGHRHGRDGLGAVGGTIEGEAGETADVLERVLVSGRLEPCLEHRAGLDAGQVAPAHAAPGSPRWHAARPSRRLGRLVDLAGRSVGDARGQQSLGAGDVGVDLLGLEGDQRVGQGHGLGQDVQERRRQLGLAGAQPRLDQLQIPVAQLAVDEVIEAERGVGEVEALDVGRQRPRGRAAAATGSSGPRRRWAWPPP